MHNSKIYLDTNVVADIIDETRMNHTISLKLLKYLALNNYNIYISEDMLTTLYYILKDKKEILIFFKNLVFIDWNVSAFGLDVIKSATNLSLENSLDLEDVLQCLCAKQNGCEVLITNDNKFYDCGLEIYKTVEFLDKYDI
jgi:predicted nucleic acid-binding protein